MKSIPEPPADASTPTAEAPTIAHGETGRAGWFWIVVVVVLAMPLGAALLWQRIHNPPDERDRLLVRLQRQVIQQIQKDSHVAAALGIPIQAVSVWGVELDVKAEGGVTIARMKSPIRGPEGNGIVEVTGHRLPRGWELTRLWVWVEGQRQPIVVVPESAGEEETGLDSPNDLASDPLGEG